MSDPFTDTALNLDKIEAARKALDAKALPDRDRTMWIDEATNFDGIAWLGVDLARACAPRETRAQRSCISQAERDRRTARKKRAKKSRRRNRT